MIITFNQSKRVNNNPKQKQNNKQNKRNNNKKFPAIKFIQFFSFFHIFNEQQINAKRKRKNIKRNRQKNQQIKTSVPSQFLMIQHQHRPTLRVCDFLAIVIKIIQNRHYQIKHYYITKRRK